METSKMFWARHLKDAPAASFPRFPSPTYRPVGNATLDHQVSLNRQSQSTLTTTTILKGAWALLMGLYSNSNDVITGLTLDAHSAGGVGDPILITIPFRISYQRDKISHEWLANIQEQFTEAQHMKQLDFSEIEQISPDAKAACGFRTMLVILSTQKAPPKGIYSSLGRGLTLECELTAYSSSLIKAQVKATYDSALLNKEQVQQMLLQFEHIVHHLCLEDPYSRISDAQSPNVSDLEQIFSWNSSVPSSQEHLVHDLIKAHTLMDRDHLAICSWDGDLSYGELDDLSSRLSSYLITRSNVGPEILVPVCFEKSKFAVVAMLAILKAGGACVPLSPAHPVSRLRILIEDLGESCASIVLTSESSQQKFEGMKPTLVVDAALLNTLSKDAFDIPTTAPSSKFVPNNIAFIIATSGSTGKPKQIMLEHSAICTSGRHHGRMINLGPHSRVFQFAAYNFDISISDIFVTLMHGGTICIPSEHDRMNNLAGAIKSMKANLLSVTASVVSHLSPKDLNSLNVLVVAGEPLTKDVVERWSEHVNLINMYGPAECTIYSTGQPSLQRNADASIIGKGVGARIWITNEEDPNVLAPIGTVGEILIEGPILARKYLNNDDATKVAFIHDPTWVRPNSTAPRRFYRTGDLARYTTDGLIRFEGRKDDGQVKLRGQRIEPGEVEYQIQACLSKPVESVVSAIKVNEQVKLAAFLVVGAANYLNGNIETSEIDGSKIMDSPALLELFRTVIMGLEKKLQLVLPGYMVPSLFIPISKIPRTFSFKVDRKKLQSLVADLTIEQLSGFLQAETTSSPPTTIMEKRLAGLWEQLLTVTRVGKDDNFFQQGGDSVGAMRLVAAARQKGLSVTVDAIFKNPILSQMALTVREEVKEVLEVLPFSLLDTADVEHLCQEAASQCKTTIEDIQDIYPCTSQQIYWIDGGNTREHQVQIVYDMPASVDVDRFRAAWDSVAKAHEILRTRIIRSPSGTFNVVLKTGLDWQLEPSLEAYLKVDRNGIMGLGDRLQRFCIVNDHHLGKRFFVFTAQHSSYDAWSLYVLMKDRDHAYHHGVSAATGPKFSQYIQPVVQESYKAAARNFWQSHMAGAKSQPFLVVPEGHQVFPDSRFNRDFKLSKNERPIVTTSTMIEVAWAIVYSRAINEEAVVLDILRHGRNAPIPGVMDLTAPTITAIPFLIRVKPEETIQSLLRWAQDELNTIDSFEHFGFANVAKLSPETALACKNSFRIHILPPLSDLQKEAGIQEGIDLPTRWVELCFALPIRVDCVVTKDGIGLEASFDKDLISPDQVNTYFDQFQSVINQLAKADAKQKIGDITFSGTLDHTSVLIESIAAESAKVKAAMLTPQPPSAKPITGSYIIGRW